MALALALLGERVLAVLDAHAVPTLARFAHEAQAALVLLWYVGGRVCVCVLKCVC